jgi:hypothetical protein
MYERGFSRYCGVMNKSIPEPASGMMDLRNIIRVRQVEYKGRDHSLLSRLYVIFLNYWT